MVSQNNLKRLETRKSILLVLLGLAGAFFVTVYVSRPSEEQLCKNKLEALAFAEASTRADFFRARSECIAKQIEYGNSHPLASSCIEFLEVQHTLAQETLSSVRARYADADVAECIKQRDIGKIMSTRNAEIN